MRKKIIALLSILILLIGLDSRVAYAIAIVDFSCWYSDTSVIYYWPTSSVTTYIGTNSSNTTFSITNLTSRVNTGFNNWHSTTNLSKVATSVQSSAELVVGGITESDAISLGIPDNVPGLTYYNGTLRYQGFVNNTLHDVKEFNAASVFFIDSSEFSDIDWTLVTCHELGHAFGYAGHYSSGHIMTSYYENITDATPNTYELNHLGNVY